MAKRRSSDLVIDDDDRDPPARAAGKGSSGDGLVLADLSFQDRIPAFGEAVARLVTPRGVPNWRDKVAALWREAQDSFEHVTPATQKSYASRFRRAAREALVAAGANDKRVREVRELFPSDPELLAKLNAAYRAKVMSDVRELSHVADWEDILGAYREMLGSGDPHWQMIGLIGTTGRRFYEVLESGRLRPIVEVHQRDGFRVRVTQRWAVAFTGQLKTREAENTTHGKTFGIPTLAPARLVVGALEALRASSQGRRWIEEGAAKANSALNPKLNAMVRDHKVMRAAWPRERPLSLKELRALYAEIAYYQFAPAQIHKAAYFSQILGHREDDVQTALSYMRYRLTEDDSAHRAEIQRIMEVAKSQEAERGQPVITPEVPVPDEEGEAEGANG